MISRSWAILASGRLAVVLLAVLTALLLLYLWIPQFAPEERAALEDWIWEWGAAARVLHAAGLTDIRHSLWLKACFALMFLNLLACMVRRFPAVASSWSAPPAPPGMRRRHAERTVERGRLETADLAAFLEGRGYHVREGEGTVSGVRGRLHLVGHWIFHVGLLGLIAAGGWLAAGDPPFRGKLGLGEGEPFDLHQAPYLAVNRPPGEDMPGLRFLLDEVDVVTRGDRVERFEATLSTPRGGKGGMGVNRPYRSAPYQILAQSFGYMPGWVIVNRRGRMWEGAWVKLPPFPGEEEDSFPIGRGRGRVHVRFFPNHAGEGAERQGDAYHLANPRFQARIDLQGEKIFEGLLEPEQRVDLGDGTDFFFLPEIRRYVLIDVIEEQGIGLLLVWFGIIVLGLAVRYGRVRKEVVLEIQQERVRVTGWGELFPSLFEEELDRLAADLEARGRRNAGKEQS